MGLTGKGFLLSNGMEFQVEPEISACLTVLEQARGLLIFNPKEEENPQYFCYPGEKLLVFQPAIFKAGSIKMWRMDWECFEELMEENGRETELFYYRKEQMEPQEKYLILRQGEGYLLNEEKFSIGELGRELKELIKRGGGLV